MDDDFYKVLIGAIIAWAGTLVKTIVASSTGHKDRENALLINDSINMIYQWANNIIQICHASKGDISVLSTYKVLFPPMVEAGTLDDFVATSFVDWIRSIDSQLIHASSRISSDSEIESIANDARLLAKELRWYKIRLESRLTHGALSRWIITLSARRSGLRSIR